MVDCTIVIKYYDKDVNFKALPNINQSKLIKSFSSKIGPAKSVKGLTPLIIFLSPYTY